MKANLIDGSTASRSKVDKTTAVNENQIPVEDQKEEIKKIQAELKDQHGQTVRSSGRHKMDCQCQRCVKKRADEQKQTVQAERQHLRPLFLTINLLLGAVKIRELDEMEIETGIDAWFPIYEKYLSTLGEYSIWLPPLIWIGGVAAVRKDDIAKKKKQPEGLSIASEEKQKTDAKK